MKEKFRRLQRWLGDAGRLYWGLLYWNSRKTAYVVGGRRSVCPCQDLSDTGHPGETGCDAVHGWNDPRRFRRICPHVRPAPHGWVCSIPAEEVRPHWGRALLLFAGTTVVLYLLLALAGWGVIRAAGVRSIPAGHLVWPPAWRQLKGDFADHYKQRALQAFRRREFQTAYLALSTALQYRPDDYETDLLLAQITAFQGSGNLSDANFVRLSLEYPAQVHRTAVVYHDTLLATGRWSQLGQHCLRMALVDRRETAAWVQSLFHAARAGRVTEELFAKFPAELAALPGHPRLLLEAQRELERGWPDSARRILQEHYAGPLNPTYALLHIDMVLRLGRADLAAMLYGHYAVALSPAQESCVQYLIDCARGDMGLARVDLAAAWRRPPDPVSLNHLLAVLMACPDRAGYLNLRRRLEEKPNAELPYGALWVAALRSGCPEDAPESARRLAAQSGDILPELSRIDLRNEKAGAPASMNRLISLVPLSREQIWVLLDAPEAAALRH